MYKYRAVVNRVIDGDTIEATIDLCFRILSEQRLRLLGIDAPEPREEAGERSKEYLRERIEGKEVIIEVAKADGFGRYLAIVYVEDGDNMININEELLSKGFAEVYKRRK